MKCQLNNYANERLKRLREAKVMRGAWTDDVAEVESLSSKN